MKLTNLGRVWRRAAAVAALGTVGLLAASPGMAANPHQVDPAAMKPTLNPAFAPWSCFTAGTGITCQGDAAQSYHEPVGFSCDGHDVWVTGSGREHMTRWHTADGLATKTIVALDYPGDVFALTEDGSGSTLTVRGHWQRHYTYLVPGELSSRVLSEIGAIYLVNVPGSGIVLHDTGKVTFAPGQDFEQIAVMMGVHEYYSDPAGFEGLVCDQLTGS